MAIQQIELMKVPLFRLATNPDKHWRKKKKAETEGTESQKSEQMLKLQQLAGVQGPEVEPRNWRLGFKCLRVLGPREMKNYSRVP